MILKEELEISSNKKKNGNSKAKKNLDQKIKVSGKFFNMKKLFISCLFFFEMQVLVRMYECM